MGLIALLCLVEEIVGERRNIHFEVCQLCARLVEVHVLPSLGPRPNTNSSADRFQYYTYIRTGIRSVNKTGFLFLSSLLFFLSPLSCLPLPSLSSLLFSPFSSFFLYLFLSPLSSSLPLLFLLSPLSPVSLASRVT